MATGPLYLTILRQGQRIAMDLTEVDPVVSRGQLAIEEGLLTEISEDLARIVTLANKQAVLRIVSPPAMDASMESAHTALQRLGTLLFSHLFPPATRERLIAAPPTDVILRLDDQLVHIPWELAFDGQEFLLTKFRIGRQVITQHQRSVVHSVGRLQDPTVLKMLIIVDPTETLPAAVEEAGQICDFLAAYDHLEVTIKSGMGLRKIDLLQDLNTYDLVHYAGHAVFDPQEPERSGWVLHDTVLTALELRRLTHPPLLVFANACQAGATARWEAETIYEGQVFGIGSAFLLAGTQHYIGTFCVIHDAHSAAFAADFYRHLLQGECLGVALAVARHQARQASGSSGLLWASYMHYGNPTVRLPLVTTHEAGGLDPRLEVGSTALAVLSNASSEEGTAPRKAPGAVGADEASSAPEPPADPEEAATAPTDIPPATRHFGGWKKLWFIVLGVCLGLTGVLGVFWLHQPEDAWTSRPLTIALLPLQHKGTPASGVHADELVETRLMQALQAGGRLKVVERALLDKVLAELGLGTSDLVDPQAALRVGRLLAARFIATGSVKYIGAKMQLSIRIIETETTATPATEAETVENLEALDNVVQHVSRNLRQHIHHAYPLQGRITHITPQGVLLNIGTQHGATPGLAMQVLQSATPFDLETPIGQMVVTHVEARRSRARILTSSLAVQPGWRVREGQGP